MANILSFLMKIFKLKYIFVFLSLFLIFVFLLFPMREINDFVTGLVLKQTQNQIYVTFDDIDLSLLTGVGATLQKVELEAPFLQTVKANSVSAHPSIASLLRGKISGAAEIEGAFGGNFKFSMGTPKKSGSSEQLMTPLDLNVQSVRIKDLRSALKMNLPVTGVADLSAKGEVDVQFVEQPELEFNLSAKPLGLENFELQTQMGPIPLPRLNFKTTTFKGRLVAGKLHIDEGVLGQAGDALRGTVKGSLDLQLLSQNGKVVPQIGGYSFDIKLDVAQKFVEDNSFMFLAVSSFKVTEAGRETYKFKVSATNPMLPPSFGALR